MKGWITIKACPRQRRCIGIATENYVPKIQANYWPFYWRERLIPKAKN